MFDVNLNSGFFPERGRHNSLDIVSFTATIRPLFNKNDSSKRHPAKIKMKLNLIKLVSGLVLWGIATSAYSLTIIPTFDGSITNDPNGVAMTNAINYAISVLQSNFTDNVTVKIHFTNDVNVSLGQSSTVGNDYAYPTFLAALKNSATSRNDTNGYSQIPNTATDPVVGGSSIYLNKAPARLLGLTTTTGRDGFDSTINLNMPLMNFTRPPGDPDKYDLAQVTEHEVDEVLGISSDLPDMTEISPIDLFRYTTNRIRTYITNSDDAYFSADGTNLLARYNMDPGGDYGDWWSVNYPTNWSPVTGNTVNYPQVQDAYSGPGNALDLGSAELAALDVVGWTPAFATANTAPSLKIVRTAANQFTLSWTNTATGYVLQENTNLLTSATWIASATGTTNPAVIVSSTARKFYRLYKAVTPFVAQPKTVTFDLATSPDQIRIHITHRSRL